jgi:hypothetical protein
MVILAANLAKLLAQVKVTFKLCSVVVYQDRDLDRALDSEEVTVARQDSRSAILPCYGAQALVLHRSIVGVGGFF